MQVAQLDWPRVWTAGHSSGTPRRGVARPEAGELVQETADWTPPPGDQRYPTSPCLGTAAVSALLFYFSPIEPNLVGTVHGTDLLSALYLSLS